MSLIFFNRKPNAGRYRVLFALFAVFLGLSFMVRTALLLDSLGKADFSTTGLIRIYGLGLIYDIGVGLFLTAIYNFYLLFLPSRWAGRLFDQIFTHTYVFIILLLVIFSFFAEFTFWQEFESRFNFIAVDYLIYTYEVVHNINESYPLPLLISGVVILVLAIILLFLRTGIFRASFQSDMHFSQRFVIAASLLLLTYIYPKLLSNSDADTSHNRYENELSKAGIYAFFAAFKNNDLNYTSFYAQLPDPEAFSLIRKELQESNSHFSGGLKTIKRVISNKGLPYKPNVIMITVESLSADFLQQFGNREHLTPVMDSLMMTGVYFSNMYATGTRTVRGMEALSLGVPPTPGNSIVRRQNNQNLSTVGHIFAEKGYSRTFYYGGDGYFDNMNEYFGGNGFDITDRGRNLEITDNYKTKRTLIGDKQVHFENAWGICDEDLFDAVLAGADRAQATGKPFYDFVMTTSNHRPFTFPPGKIDRKPGSRQAAVRYTDYAIGRFLSALRARPWYKNTVVIIVADHCASSAGKNEIDISKYHIPCMILNLPVKGQQRIDKMCSQIDLYPTLFTLLNWSYDSNWYGKNVLDTAYVPRAVLGTYQKLAYLKKDSLIILGPQRKVDTFLYDAARNEQKPVRLPTGIVHQAMANYQTAYELFEHNGFHQ
jgi:phosphoglycerol transferase MdoB-like AlkP superfamily enzyme